MNSPTREEMDAPQVLYKFTRAVERQIGEAESLSRAMGDALEERRQFQSRVWEIYERFMVNEPSSDVKAGIKVGQSVRFFVPQREKSSNESNSRPAWMAVSDHSDRSID